jgi:hypothetical protein
VGYPRGMSKLLPRHAGLACLAWVACACGSYRPPFTQASSASAQPDVRQATLVFLWPLTSCDPGGYVTLATTDGGFVGNVSAGTQLRATVPAGQYTIVGWNEQQEQASGAVTRGAVSVLHASVSEGRTYYVRLAFGEWDNRGPREIAGNRFGGGPSNRLCVAPGMSMTSAMVALPPASESWSEVAGWTAELQAIVPDRAAGQAWLDGNRDVLQYHRTVAESRFAALLPQAKQMSTVVAEDGVVTSH